MSPLWTTLAIMGAAAVLEAVMAGSETRAVLKSLRQPRWSPPFALWVAIGLAYYLIFGAILYRLLADGGDWNLAGIVLVILILLVNGATNWLLFGKRDLRAYRRSLLPYGLLMLGLLALLLAHDLFSALILLPYVAYLPFAFAWVGALERLNPTGQP